MRNFVLFLMFLFLIVNQCKAQTPYSDCYKKYEKFKDSIMDKFHYYDKKRMDSTITIEEKKTI